MIVECVYACEKNQYFITLKINDGATIEDVIRASGVLENYPELSLEKLSVGIFGHKKLLTDIVCDRERVEIYRPLLVDPMEARRVRAKN